MDELEMEDFLSDALHFYSEELDSQVISHVKTFGRAGLLTSNKGLVVTLADGSEFQLTIVQSKLAEEDE